jgi:hypothetical protein
MRRALSVALIAVVAALPVCPAARAAEQPSREEWAAAGTVMSRHFRPDMYVRLTKKDTVTLLQHEVVRRDCKRLFGECVDGVSYDKTATLVMGDADQQSLSIYRVVFVDCTTQRVRFFQHGKHDAVNDSMDWVPDTGPEASWHVPAPKSPWVQLVKVECPDN